MSNVTAEEIVALTASAFNVPTKWISAVGDPYVKRMLPPMARDVACFLMRRHTRLTLREIAGYVGLNVQAPHEVTERRARCIEALRYVPELGDLIEQIEMAIDGIHEGREAEQKVLDAGVASLSGVPDNSLPARAPA